MTIKKKFVQLGAAGGVFVLLSLCGLIAGASSFFLPAEKNWWLIAGTACLPMLLGMVAAVAAYFLAGRLVKSKDEVESPPAAAPVFTEDEFGGLTTVGKPAKRTYKHLFRWLAVGLGTIFVLGLDVLAFFILGWVWWLMAIEVLIAVGGVGVYLLVRLLRNLPEKWMDKVGWPVISGLCVLATALFLVLAIGGPALGQTISVWLGQTLPDLPVMKIFGTVLGYVVWAAIGAGGLLVYNRSVGLFDGSPSKGVIAVTVSLPILAIAAFFGFELIAAIAESFAKVWLLYAILAAVLTAAFMGRRIGESTVWENGLFGLVVSVAVFAAAWLISWAVMSSVGATWGMFGQGAMIVAVALTYGIYLSWERSGGSGPGGGQ